MTIKLIELIWVRVAMWPSYVNPPTDRFSHSDLDLVDPKLLFAAFIVIILHFFGRLTHIWSIETHEVYATYHVESQWSTRKLSTTPGGASQDLSFGYPHRKESLENGCRH